MTPYKPARSVPAKLVYAHCKGDAFIAGDYYGKRYTSDSFILEFNSDMPTPGRAELRPDAPKADAINSLMLLVDKLAHLECAFSNGNCEYVRLTSEDVTATLNRKYYDYFNRKYKGAVFMVAGKYNPVVVKQGAETVGMIAPIMEDTLKETSVMLWPA